MTKQEQLVKLINLMGEAEEVIMMYYPFDEDSNKDNFVNDKERYEILEMEWIEPKLTDMVEVLEAKLKIAKESLELAKKHNVMDPTDALGDGNDDDGTQEAWAILNGTLKQIEVLTQKIR